jgi:hypothetical protein
VARPTTGTDATIARIEGGVVSRKIVGETILVPITGKLADLQRVFALNPVAEFIWERLDGKRRLAEIRDDIVVAFEVAPQRAEDDLLELVSELLEEGLVTERR